MKKPLLTEKQYNLIEFCLAFFFLFVMSSVILNRTIKLLPVVWVHQIWTSLLFYVFFPLRLILTISKWTKLIPDYKANILSVIWPNYSQENYPRLHLSFQVANILIAVGFVLICAYLIITHKI